MEQNMNMIAVKTALSFGLAISAMATMARAEDINVERLQRIPEVHAAISACMADRSRLCADVMPGQGRIVRCLAARSDQLSPSCATAMDNASAALTSAGVVLKPGAASK